MKKKYLIPETSICLLTASNLLTGSPDLHVYNSDGDVEVTTDQVLSRQDPEWD